MSGWSEIRGHGQHVERFRTAIRKNRLGSTFLFTGLPGIGKRLFARGIAQAALCERHTEEEFEFCGECATCMQVKAGTHLDVVEIAKPEDKKSIPIELLIGERGQRMREGLVHAVSMRPASGRRRVAIIDDADDLNEEGANALLKTLEEPPPFSILILLGTSTRKQLPTIRSRCQTIRFAPLSQMDVVDILVREGIAETAEQASQAARFAGGSVEAAQFWFTESNFEFRSDWLKILSTSPFNRGQAIERLSDLLQEAGSDNWKKRASLRLAAEVSMSYYQSLLRYRLDLEDERDDCMRSAVSNHQGQEHFPTLQISTALERCEQTLHEIAANANPNLLIDVWVGDLAKLSRGQWVSESKSA